MAKIEPFLPYFENMQALLARMSEDEEAIGFVGCIVRKDGSMPAINFNVTREQMSFAAALWLGRCLEDG